MQAGGFHFTWKLVVIIIVAALVVLTLVYWLTPETVRPRVQGYISMISAVGVMIGIFSFVLQQQAQQDAARQSNAAAGLSFIQANWTNLLSYFQNNPDLQSWWKKLNPWNKELQSQPDLPTKPETEYKKIIAAQQIFQFIDNITTYITARGVGWDAPSLETWRQILRSMFTDDFLRRQWEESKQFYTLTTQQAVEKYFLQ